MMHDRATTHADFKNIRIGIVLPGLRCLRLSHADFEELKTQGFVSAQSRGLKGPRFVLRFRSGGRQKVRYIGTDPARAERVRKELAELQKERRLGLERSKLRRQARRMLREAKVHLEPLLNAAGYAFHGQAIRRCRSRPVESPRTIPSCDQRNAPREQHDVER